MLFFDIETVPNVEALDFEPEFKAPANYKDEEKIQAYIAEQRAEWHNKMALDPDLGMVRAIGFGTDSEITSLLKDEKEMLTEFWDVLAGENGISCGYNIIGFDYPFLLRRSMALGVKVPVMPDLRKYGNNHTIDLMLILYPTGYKGLKWVTKRYGIPNVLPELKGDIVEFMTDDLVEKYVRNDVWMTRELYKLMNGVYL